MENLPLAAHTTVYVKEKHLGFVQTALTYAAKGGDLTDIFSNSRAGSVMRNGEDVDMVILKQAPEGERRASVVVAQAILNGVKVKTITKSDMFCSGCSGGCAS